LSPNVPNVRTPPPSTWRVEDAAKIRFDGEPTPPPITTLPGPIPPIVVVACGPVVSMRKIGSAPVEVAIVQAYCRLLTIVDVASVL